jgi:hypothetical protein
VVRLCLILLALAGCSTTYTSGNLSTGEYMITSFRLFQDVALSMQGPGDTGATLTSNASEVAMAKLVETLGTAVDGLVVLRKPDEP